MSDVNFSPFFITELTWRFTFKLKWCFCVRLNNFSSLQVNQDSVLFLSGLLCIVHSIIVYCVHDGILNFIHQLDSHERLMKKYDWSFFFKLYTLSCLFFLFFLHFLFLFFRSPSILMSKKFVTSYYVLTVMVRYVDCWNKKLCVLSVSNLYCFVIRINAIQK